uniref:aECM cysteine-cradle domain-containing protein n=1 Tax=Wuchereria bancrofti TaxID=6293 RepID=A0AAF5Q5A8_WUCBA
MFAKIIILLLLHIIAVFAEEKPFLDLKKVIRGALDVVAAVPTSPTTNYDFGNASQLTAPNGIQGIDPIIRERLSRLFHIPPDFVHRLAAQAGFIDYEPTTAKPFLNYWFKPKPNVPHVNPEYSTSSAFIQEDPSVASNSANNDLSINVQQKGSVNTSQTLPNYTITEQQAAILQSEQQAVIFQPVIKDGHLYYQPFGVLPQVGQPKMIIYGGRLYMATPLQSETHAQVAATGDMIAQNSSDMTDEKDNDHKVSDISNEEMHYRRIYAQHMKAAEDAQVQADKLQKVIVPDASSIEIVGIESKPRTSSSYRKVHKKKLESHNMLHQFNLQKKPQEANSKLAREDQAGSNQKHEMINSRMAIQRISSFNQPAETATDFTDKNFKQFDNADNPTTDAAIEEQTTISNEQTDKLLTGILSQEKIDKYENNEFMNKNQSMQQILALRRRMATDRKKFAERKRLLSSMKQKVIKDEDMNREIFRRHCYNIRSLAQQFGFTNIKQYVISNCIFIENYYPEFNCREAEASISKCEKLF